MEVKLGGGRFTALNGVGLAPVTRGAGHQPGAGGHGIPAAYAKISRLGWCRRTGQRA